MVAQSLREPWLYQTDPHIRGLVISIFAWIAETERAQLIARTKHIGRPAVAVHADQWRRAYARAGSVDAHGFPVTYASVMRFVRQIRGAAAPEAHAVIQTPPGEEGQVDYGDGPMVRHPATGKYRRTRLFLLTLGYSGIPEKVGEKYAGGR